MGAAPDNADQQELWHAQTEAQSFRERREAVYPGRLVVLRGGSFASQPVDDDAFDPSVERIIGIAIWGACAEWTPGMVLIEDGSRSKLVPVIASDVRRPSTGIGRVDAWIERADVLRKLCRGTVATFGGIPLTQNQLIAAFGEVGKVVRESAIALLRHVPRDQRPVLLALARVADAQFPQDEDLSAAVVELTASAPGWTTSGGVPSVMSAMEKRIEELEVTTAAIPPALEKNRVSLDRITKAVESQSQQDKTVLPELKAHDRQAWQLATLHGMTQDKVAAALNKEHGTTYTQGQVSRMIARAKAHANANGLAEKVAKPIGRPRTVDPGTLELGARVDKRKPRRSDIARQSDDE